MTTLDKNAQRWLDDVATWQVKASQVFWKGAEQEITKGYDYCYFSPMRPLSFVGASVDHVLVASTEPYHDFMYTREPLPVERIQKWELIPMDERTWQATGWQPEEPYDPFE